MIRIKRDDITFECDTPAEAVALSAEWNDTPASTPRNTRLNIEAPPNGGRYRLDMDNITTLPKLYAKAYGAVVHAGARGVATTELIHKGLVQANQMGMAGAWLRRVERATNKPMVISTKHNGTTYWTATPHFRKLYARLTR